MNLIDVASQIMIPVVVANVDSDLEIICEIVRGNNNTCWQHQIVVVHHERRTKNENGDLSISEL